MPSPQPRASLAAGGVLLSALFCVSCNAGTDLGTCDMEAAEELVYGRDGLVATKGQALTHDSCGNGAFCHSESAVGGARYGAPHGMNFDMLPSAQGLGKITAEAEECWSQVEAEYMPPRGSQQAVVGDGGWSFDPQRRDGEPMLPTLDSEAGKAAFRNWLSCGAPVVVETRLPAWAVPEPAFDPEGADWSAIYDEVLKPRCATSGCHNPQAAAGGLAMGSACETYKALSGQGPCGKPWVVPGDATQSFLVEKMQEDEPSCGGTMPPVGALPEDHVKALASWIDRGAEGNTCPD